MTIQFKRSNTLGKLPLLTDLKVGELAINMADRQIYTNNGTAIVPIGGGDPSKFLPLTGGTLTGQLILSNDPTADTHISTKQYVDNKPGIISGFTAPSTATNGTLFIGVNPVITTGTLTLPMAANASITTNRDRTLTVILQDGKTSSLYSYDCVNWYSSAPLPAGNTRWMSVHGTKDGTFHVAAGISLTYAISTDGAKTWVSKTLPGTGTRDVWNVRVSQNKQRIFMGGTNEVLVSQDGGLSWTVKALVAGTYESLSMSDDGMRAIIGSNVSGKTSYYTEDGGVTWVYVELPVTGTWKCNALSADGLRGAFVSSTNINAIVKTVDGGKTYTLTPVQNPHGSSWGVCMSQDGSRVVMSKDTTLTIYSDDFLNTTKITNSVNLRMSELAMSANGMKLVGVGINSNLYSVSDDGGVTWTNQQIPAPATLSGIQIRSLNQWPQDQYFNKFGGDMFGDVNMNNNIVTGVYKPFNDNDGANKQYVDNKRNNFITYNIPSSTLGKHQDTATQMSVTSPSVPILRPTTLSEAGVYFGENANEIYVTGGGGGNVFHKSIDGGVTWTSVAVGASGTWASIIPISSDGKVAWYIVYNGNGCRRTLDGGATWQTFNYVFGTKVKYAIKMTGNGQKGFVTSGTSAGDGIYSTTNYGETWVQNRTLPLVYNTTLMNAALSADGSNGYVIPQGYTKPGGMSAVLRTTDAGATWSTVTLPTTADPIDITLSSNGMRGVMITSNGLVLYTTDGVTWALTTAPSQLWKYVRTSADGMKVVAITNTASAAKSMYSTDGGVTWTLATDTFPTLASTIISMNMSPDGKYVAATVNGSTNNLLLSTNSGKTWSFSTPETQSAVIMSYTKVNDTWKPVTKVSSPGIPTDTLTATNIGIPVNDIKNRLQSIPAIKAVVDEKFITELTLKKSIDTVKTILADYKSRFDETIFNETNFGKVISTMKSQINTMRSTYNYKIITEVNTVPNSEYIARIQSSVPIKLKLNTNTFTETNITRTIPVMNGLLTLAQQYVIDKPLTLASMGESSAYNLRVRFLVVTTLATNKMLTELDVGSSVLDFKNKMLSIPALQTLGNKNPLNETNIENTIDEFNTKVNLIPSIQLVMDDKPITVSTIGAPISTTKDNFDSTATLLTDKPLTVTNIGSSIADFNTTLAAINTMQNTLNATTLTETNMGLTAVDIKNNIQNIEYQKNTTSYRIGSGAGAVNQGINAIAIGNNAGALNQHDGSVCLGANSESSDTNQIVLGSSIMTTVVSKCHEYVDNAAALSDGLLVGTLYRSGEEMRIVI